MQVAYKNIIRLTVLLAIVSALAAASSGFGTRFNIWEFATGFAILKWSAYGGIAAVVLAVISIIFTFIVKAPRFSITVVLAGLLGFAVFAIPYWFAQQFGRYPTVADASTSLNDPPVFVALVAAREQTAQNPLAYRHAEAAALQQQYFPGLESLLVTQEPAAVIEQAATIANDMGMSIAVKSPAAGRLEATATTFWYGFKDDVIVRARSQADGMTAVDVRSASRIGYLDGGVNAKRVQQLLAALKEASH